MATLARVTAAMATSENVAEANTPPTPRLPSIATFLTSLATVLLFSTYVAIVDPILSYFEGIFARNTESSKWCNVVAQSIRRDFRRI
jgi:hypothetical protein